MNMLARLRKKKIIPTTRQIPPSDFVTASPFFIPFHPSDIAINDIHSPKMNHAIKRQTNHTITPYNADLDSLDFAAAAYITGSSFPHWGHIENSSLTETPQKGQTLVPSGDISVFHRV